MGPLEFVLLECPIAAPWINYIFSSHPDIVAHKPLTSAIHSLVLWLALQVVLWRENLSRGLTAAHIHGPPLHHKKTCLCLCVGRFPLLLKFPLFSWLLAELSNHFTFLNLRQALVSLSS